MSKAAATRHDILEKAFQIIYTKGYQTTSVDEIIAATKVTKGAFYYHFRNKDEMGVAIINEIVRTDAAAIPFFTGNCTICSLNGYRTLCAIIFFGYSVNNP